MLLHTHCEPPPEPEPATEEEIAALDPVEDHRQASRSVYID